MLNTNELSTQHQALLHRDASIAAQRRQARTLVLPDLPAPGFLARSPNRKAARQPCFAGPRLAGHQKILVPLDPLTSEHIAFTTFFTQ